MLYNLLPSIALTYRFFHIYILLSIFNFILADFPKAILTSTHIAIKFNGLCNRASLNLLAYLINYTCYLKYENQLFLNILRSMLEGLSLAQVFHCETICKNTLHSIEIEWYLCPFQLFNYLPNTRHKYSFPYHNKFWHIFQILGLK